MSLSSSEYLRRKMAATVQTIAPRRLADASQLTQIRRYAAAAASPVGSRSDGNMLVPSADARLACLGGSCTDNQKVTVPCCPTTFGAQDLPRAYQGGSLYPCTPPPVTAQLAPRPCHSSGPGYTRTYLANDIRTDTLYAAPPCKVCPSPINAITIECSPADQTIELNRAKSVLYIQPTTIGAGVVYFQFFSFNDTVTPIGDLLFPLTGGVQAVPLPAGTSSITYIFRCVPISLTIGCSYARTDLFSYLPYQFINGEDAAATLLFDVTANFTSVDLAAMGVSPVIWDTTSVGAIVEDCSNNIIITDLGQEFLTYGPMYTVTNNTMAPVQIVSGPQLLLASSADKGISTLMAGCSSYTTSCIQPGNSLTVSNTGATEEDPCIVHVETC